MLSFFRKYQRIVFIFVTVVVIASFSFFGSYSNFSAPTPRDQVAFTAIDGTQVKRSELQKMVLFLSSDAHDMLEMGPNFLNDGVVRHDLLRSGLGAMLAVDYLDVIGPDLTARAKREQLYKLYTHPHAKFINAEAVWEQYAPDIHTHLSALKESDSSPSKQAFAHRVQLYLAQEFFPPSHLRAILGQEESQFSWLPRDARLHSHDLALFGYHSLEEWFGPRFISLSAQFLVNTSIVAVEKGYTVTKQEAWCELRKQAEKSFAQSSQRHHLDVADSRSYLNNQLAMMGLSRDDAIGIWQQVMLFRRLFNDVGATALLDVFSLERFGDFAEGSAQIETYQLDPTLRLKDENELRQFEAYLDATFERDPEELALLPQTLKSLDQIAPEFRQIRYTLEIAKLRWNDVALQVPLKEVWEWELDEANWPTLCEHLPLLQNKEGATPEDRFATLMDLDRPTRRQVDAIAANQILKTTPERVGEALTRVPANRIEVGLSPYMKRPLPGISDSKELFALIEQASLGPCEEGSKLWCYSQNGTHYYRLSVIDRTQEEVMTFREAVKGGVLETLASEIDLEEVSNQLYAAISPFTDEDKSMDLLANYRFYPELARIQQDIQERGKESRAVASQWQAHNRSEEQFKVIYEKIKLQRCRPDERFGEAVFAMAPSAWSSITKGDEGPYFFQLTDHLSGAKLAAHQLAASQQALAYDAERCFMIDLLVAIRARNAMGVSISEAEERL